jgi:hypothetical protein
MAHFGMTIYTIDIFNVWFYSDIIVLGLNPGSKQMWGLRQLTVTVLRVIHIEMMRSD